MKTLHLGFLLALASGVSAILIYFNELSDHYENHQLSDEDWETLQSLQSSFQKCVELAGDDVEVDVRQIGSISCVSIITALSYSEGKLFVDFGDRSVEVYYHGK